MYVTVSPLVGMGSVATWTPFWAVLEVVIKRVAFAWLVNAGLTPNVCVLVTVNAVVST